MTVYRSGLKTWPVGIVQGKIFALDGDRGINVWVDITNINGGNVVWQLQECSPRGTWVNVTGALSASISANGATLMKIYPGLTPVANQVINTALGGGGYRIVASVGAAPVTAEVSVESIT